VWRSIYALLSSKAESAPNPAGLGTARGVTNLNLQAIASSNLLFWITVFSYMYHPISLRGGPFNMAALLVSLDSRLHPLNLYGVEYGIQFS
jgi:hypothetical protein